MRIGLAAYRCENGNTAFNLSQIERAMGEARGKADLLCFGEAFLQGFDAFCWDYETDRSMAVGTNSEPTRLLRKWTEQYGLALLTGYLERDGERLYSSCAVIEAGEILCNYRRVTKGWKEYWRTDAHYCEGDSVGRFRLCGHSIAVALCGDLWDCPERFRTDDPLIWPVYVDYSPEEWESEGIEDYARQAALAAKDVLMVNPIDDAPRNHGGAFHFQNGKVLRRLPFDREAILYLDID